MKRDDEERSKLFSRRAILLGGLQGVALTALVARMYYLQVSESERYQLLSDDNRINIKLEPPVRGLIYDRHGEPLAINDRSYNLVVSAERWRDVEKSLWNLKPLIGVDDEQIEQSLRLVRIRPSFTVVSVKEDLTWEEVTKIEANAPDLPGIRVDVNYLRRYPIAEPMAHVVGYVGKAFREDVEQQRDPVLLLPGFRIGRSGIELSLESSLRGAAGRKLVESNAIGREVRLIRREPSENGLQLDLTIDALLQQRIHARLMEERSAAAIVMNVHTGEVHSAVSTPSFDPNDFVRGFSRDKWEALRGDDRAPFRNKALAGTYAPGSTYKMMVALAAMRAGLSPFQNYDCRGKVILGSQTFHCWKRSGHGNTDLRRSLKESCDVYYYYLAERLGNERIAQMAREFGFGTTQSFDMLGERKGLVPTDAWKREKREEGWRTGDTLQVSIGQGFVLTTPMQLAAMISQLVNGGYSVSPHFVKQEVPLARTRLNVPAEHLSILKDAMDAVANEVSGTAFKARITDPEFAMGGKTGTTQVRSISSAEREGGVLENDELPWRFRDHALFVGYAPVNNPKYACCVVVEHGGSGGATAAPIASDILLAVQQRDPELRGNDGTSEGFSLTQAG